MKKYAIVSVSALVCLLSAACSSTDASADLRCVDRTLLSFQPPISSDGEYRIVVGGGSLDTTCTASITGGILSEFACTGTTGGGGAAAIRGGQSQEVDGNTGKASEATRLDGLEWYRLAAQASVIVEKNGQQVVAAPNVTFAAVATPAECPSDSGANVAGTVVLP